VTTDGGGWLGEEEASVVAALTARLDAARPYNIGFPGATDFNYTGLGELLGRQLLNNIGDPFRGSAAVNQTMAMEREVVTFVADLLRAPADDRWGYVTTGGSEGNLYGLYLARSRFPDAMTYVSAQAHYSALKGLEILGLAHITIGCDHTGAMDTADLAAQVDRNRHRPAIVLATAGTTMAEAVDNVTDIVTVLDNAAVHRRHVHVDAALSGIPLALWDGPRPGFDFADGADSMSSSGHKFLGTPTLCGVVVVKASHRARVAQHVGYTGSPDATLLGSRSGHAPLMLWCALRRHGIEGLRARAAEARKLAGYTHAQLASLGWESSRLPHAFTVVLRTPPASVMDRWVLATDGGWSHIVTMPGVDPVSINAFVEAMRAALDGGWLAAARAELAVPTQRSTESMIRRGSAGLVAV
jgi:histidine decarboxylase